MHTRPKSAVYSGLLRIHLCSNEIWYASYRTEITYLRAWLQLIQCALPMKNISEIMQAAGLWRIAVRVFACLCGSRWRKFNLNCREPRPIRSERTQFRRGGGVDLWPLERMWKAAPARSGLINCEINSACGHEGAHTRRRSCQRDAIGQTLYMAAIGLPTGPGKSAC